MDEETKAILEELKTNPPHLKLVASFPERLAVFSQLLEAQRVCTTLMRSVEEIEAVASETQDELLFEAATALEPTLKKAAMRLAKALRKVKVQSDPDGAKT